MSHDQKMTCYGGDVMTVVQCHCQLGTKPMIIVSHKLAAVCRLCNTVYEITRVIYDLEHGLNIEVSSHPAVLFPQQRVGLQ